MKEKTILLYTRPNTKEYLYAIANNIKIEKNIVSVSDFKNDGDYWMGKYLYTKKNIQNNYYSRDELDDIILRCRYLRSISFDDAKDLVVKYAYGINDVLDSISVNYIIAEIIDNYCMDIIYREAVKRNIKVISPMGTFISGYMRFTVKGEIQILNRNVSNNEAQRVLDKLLDDKFKGRVGGLGYSGNLNRGKYFYRRILIESVLNPIRKIVTKDKYNNLYNTRLYESKNILNYLGRKVLCCFTNIHDIEYGDNDIYLPLHCTPEATTEYFCDSPKFGFYEDAIIDIIRNSSNNVRFIIKDHPVMYGVRHVKFYKELLKNDNVILINPLEDSNSIMKNVNTILVCTGSAGVEGLLRGKRVLCLSNNYYSDLHPNAHVVSKVDDIVVKSEIINYDQLTFIKDLLSFHVPATMYGYSELLKTDFNSLSKFIKEYFIDEKD